jgi:hypothetical protein
MQKEQDKARALAIKEQEEARKRKAFEKAHPDEAAAGRYPPGLQVRPLSFVK